MAVSAEKILAAFLQDRPRQMDVLHEFLTRSDSVFARRQAHSIKGSAAETGGAILCETAFKMEQLAECGELKAAGNLFPRLANDFEKPKQALVQYLRKCYDRDMKALIVEDTFAHRVVLQAMLESLGAVHIAADGAEAVKAFSDAHRQKSPYDLICLDILMPEMDGQDVLKKIRAQEDAKGIFPGDGVKSVMTAALKDKINVMTAFKQQSDGYLVKPVDRAKLFSLLRSFNLIQ